MFVAGWHRIGSNVGVLRFGVAGAAARRSGAVAGGVGGGGRGRADAVRALPHWPLPLPSRQGCQSGAGGQGQVQVPLPRKVDGQSGDGLEDARPTPLGHPLPPAARGATPIGAARPRTRQRPRPRHPRPPPTPRAPLRPHRKGPHPHPRPPQRGTK